jgi:predicted MFS family arabinose efflux permease
VNPVRSAWRYLAAQGMGRALRHRDFRIYVINHFISASGYWVQKIGIGWITWEMTHDGLWLGIIAAADSLPIWILAPFAGTISDRVDRLKMYRYLQFVNFALDLVLLALVFTGQITPYILAGLILLNGVLNALMLPLRLTLGPNLVPREDIPSAISLHSVSFQCSVFVGPAIAGVVISELGVEWTFVCYTVTYINFIAALYMVKMNRDEHVVGKGTGVLRETWEGFRYVAHHKAIAPLLLLILSFALCSRPYLDLMPGFADAVFGRGAQGLAMLVSASGIGGILAGLWIAHYGRTTRMTRIVFVSVFILAVTLFAFAVTDWFALAVVCVAVVSATANIGSTGSQMLIQGAVDGAMRGRVMSIYGITWRGAPAIGALLMGAATSAFGLQAPLAAGAVICVVVWLLVLPKRRVLERGLEAPAVSPRA